MVAMQSASVTLALRLTGWTDQGRPVVQGLEEVTIQGQRIPAGFLSDGASVPMLLQAIDPEMASLGKAFLAAYYHDYACAIGAPKAERSERFRAQLLLDGVRPLTAEVMYLAVLGCPGPETETVEKVAPIPADYLSALSKAS